MKIKNIQLINAEEVSNLFQTKYGESSFIGALSGEKQIDLVTAASSTNAIVQGEQLEIQIGENYKIQLNEYQQDIIVELRDLGWGVLLFINEEAHYLRVNRKAQESEFEAIKNYPTLKIVDFGSGKNEVIKNLDSLVNLKHLQTLNLDHCPALIDLNGLNQLTTLETLFLDGFSIESEFNYISCLKSLRGFSQNGSTIKDLNHIKDLTKLTTLVLIGCSSLTSLEGISGLTNLNSLNLRHCKSLKSLEGITGLSNLTSLNLSYCRSLTSLEGISGLTNLTSLDLSDCRSLTSLEGISGLTNLTLLDLRYCESLTSLEGISSLTNLTSLSLNNCYDLTTIEGISGLTNLTSLNLVSCKSLISLEGITGLTNLTSLDLGMCESLTSLEGISGLTSLTSLNLESCKSLTSLEVISGLTNLISLDLKWCKSLTSLEVIKGLTNLTSLDLCGCQSLTSLEGITGLTNLTSLDLRMCESLTNLEGISGLTSLTSLNLDSCLKLTRLEEILGLTNLTSLNLGWCKYLTNLEVIKGLTNLTSLNLRWCKSLTSLEGISGLTNLTSLDLGSCVKLTRLEEILGLTNLTSLNLENCKSLTSLEGISCLTNLTSLNLEMCESLTSLEVISSLTNLTSLDLCGCQSLTSLEGITGLTNLTSLNLEYCKSVIFIKKLNSLSSLNKLVLSGCSNIRDFEELIHCPNLKEVYWIQEASCSYVLTGSAVRRKDSLFIEKRIIVWIDNLKFTKIPIAFANELIAAVSLIEKEALAKEQFIHLAQAMRVRGFGDGESGNAFTATTWELWVEAVMQKSDAFQEILEFTTQNIDPDREIEVVVTPILTALAEISMLYPSAKEWAINFVMELVAPFKENEDWARTLAPAAAVFYAGMELQEEVTFWLNKGTHPHIPKWKDTILLALATYYTQKADYTNSRKYLKNITLPDVQDQGRVLLAKAMCVDFPQEALEEFIAIKDVVLQTALAKQLALESSILASSEGLYQILLCLEQTPALFSEFVVNVLEKQPSSQFVQCIEALFAQPIEKSSSATAFLALCNEPTVIENIGKLNLQEFKIELQEEVNKERVSLVKDFVSTLIEKELINEKFREKFQHDLTTNLL